MLSMTGRRSSEPQNVQKSRMTFPFSSPASDTLSFKRLSVRVELTLKPSHAARKMSVISNATFKNFKINTILYLIEPSSQLSALVPPKSTKYKKKGAFSQILYNGNCQKNHKKNEKVLLITYYMTRKRF